MNKIGEAAEKSKYLCLKAPRINELDTRELIHFPVALLIFVGYESPEEKERKVTPGEEIIEKINTLLVIAICAR